MSLYATTNRIFSKFYYSASDSGWLIDVLVKGNNPVGGSPDIAYRV
jgi:hypothetical protein